MKSKRISDVKSSDNNDIRSGCNLESCAYVNHLTVIVFYFLVMFFFSILLFSVSPKTILLRSNISCWQIYLYINKSYYREGHAWHAFHIKKTTFQIMCITQYTIQHSWLDIVTRNKENISGIIESSTCALVSTWIVNGRLRNCNEKIDLFVTFPPQYKRWPLISKFKMREFKIVAAR